MKHSWLDPALSPDAIDPEDRAILDAARAEFVHHGFRRTAVGDIARRAKVSRPTVYRRIGDKDDIIRAVVFREVLTFFAEAGPRFLQLPDPAERTAETFVAGVVAFRENALAQAVLEYEPEALADLASDEGLRSLAVLREVLAAGLVDDDLPIESARRAAEAVLRLTTSLLVAPSDLFPLESAADARAFARSVLVPIVAAARG